MAMVGQNVSNICLDIYKSRYHIIVIPSVVNSLCRHYAHIPRKHNFTYDSLCIKHGA